MERDSRVTATQSALIILPDESRENEEERILFQVKSSGEEDDNYYYWVDRNTPLLELMIDYTRRIGVWFSSVRFLVNGLDINQLSSANRLNLDDGGSTLITVIHRDESTVAAGTQRIVVGNQFVTAAKSTLIILTESDANDDENRVLFKIRDPAGNEGDQQFFYWIGRSVWLGELVIDYTKRIGVSLNSVILFYRNLSLCRRPFSTSANDLLQVKDGDSIKVNRLSNSFSPEGTESTLISLPPAEGEKLICLQLKGVGIDRSMHYLIGRNTPLAKVFMEYADRTLQFVGGIQFYNTRTSLRPIDRTKTAYDLKMENGDIIIAETFTLVTGL